MILINDDQCNVADIVLDVWLFDQKLNHSSVYPCLTVLCVIDYLLNAFFF